METPGATLNRGWELERQGQRAKAEAIYTQVLTAQPENSVALFLLGRLELESGRHQSAAEHLAAAVRVDRAQAVYHATLARAHQALGRHRDAADCYRAALELEPGGADYHVNLGNALLHCKDATGAITCFEKAIEHDPQLAEAYSCLGAVLEHLDRGDQAIARFRQAIALRGDYAAAHYNLGTALLRAGRGKEAADSLATAAQLEPRAAAAHANLAAAYHALGMSQEARQSLAQAVELAPSDPDYRASLGLLLSAAGDLDGAASAFRAALHIRPDAAVQNHLALVLRAQGAAAAAEAAFREALRLAPDFFEALNNLGALLDEQGRHAEARAYLAEAVRLRPDAFMAQNNLAHTFRRERMFDEAIAAYRSALALQEDDASAHFNLGASLIERGRYREALGEMRRVAELEPNRAEVLVNVGFLAMQLGDVEQSVAASRQALALDPNLAQAHCNLGLAYQSLGQLDQAIDSFREVVRLDPADAASHSNLLYALNFHPGYDAQRIFAEHRQWAQRHADPLSAAGAAPDNDRTPDRRLRIGYVSDHFRGHAIASFTESILAAHDAASCEVFCYSTAAAAQLDDTTARLRRYADHWRDVRQVDDEQIARMVRDDRIDILVDLAGHIGGNRLLVFARRPAPIQVTYIGYQNTTGMAAMDYRLTDAWSDPAGTTEPYYTETLVRLPRSFFVYRPPHDAPPVNPLPALASGAVTFGSFNQFAKVTPAVLRTWARLLASVPRSRLLLLAPSSETLRRRVQKIFEEQGVDWGRVEIVPRCPYQEYLGAIARADVALDAFPFNGHTTTCDCLWLGVPVVMLAGKTYASRFGSSALVNLGLEEFIALSVDQYLEIAARVAGDVEALARLRAELRTNMSQSPLVDGQGFTRHLEDAYRQMWHRWCSAAGA